MSTITRHDSDARLSRAVIHNGVVYLAGLTADKRSAGMKEQTTEIFGKIDVLLKKSGTDKSKLLSAMIWITDMRLKPAMDEAWLAWADAKNLPARACVETRLGLLWWHAEALELGMAIALANAQVQSAAGEQVKRRRLLRQQYGVVPWQDHDRGTYA